MALAVVVMPRTGHGRAAQRGDDEGGKDEGANHLVLLPEDTFLKAIFNRNATVTARFVDHR